MIDREEMMNDEFALNYAIETLQDLDEHCDNDEQRAELSEVVSVLSSMLQTYSSFQCNVTIEEEEDAEA